MKPEDLNLIAFDCETYLIGPEAIAPKMVCMSCSIPTWDDKLGVVPSSYLVGNGDESVERDLADLFEPGHTLLGHNVAFDLAVVAFSYPELEAAIWDKLMAGEVTDTLIREMLLNLSTHGNLNMMYLPDGSAEKITYHLTNLEARYLGRDRSADKEGDDIWRLRYSELDGFKADEYPEDAAKYAIEDAEGTLLVYLEQQKRVQSEEGYASLSTEAFHTAAAFALFLITCRGMATDAEQFEIIREKIMAELSPEKLEPLYAADILRRPQPAQPYSRQVSKAWTLLSDAGLIGKAIKVDGADYMKHREFLEENGIKFKGEVKASVDKKALAARITEVCKENGLPIKETAKGGVSASKEVIDELSVLDEKLKKDHEMSPLECYEHRQKLQKLVTTEIPRMMWEDELSDVVHFPYRVLLETGRTSSFANRLFPSGNGQQIHPVMRPAYKARDGFVLCSADYGTLELGTFGQANLDLFGKSIHVEVINRGDDNHSFLGARLAYLLHPEFRKLCDELGLVEPEELYASFMDCNGTDNEALQDFYDEWRKFSKPNGLGFPGTLGPLTMVSFAKKSYGIDYIEIAEKLPRDLFKVTGSLLWHCERSFGMSKEEFRWTPPVRALALAILLREAWRDFYQVKPYFDHVAENMRDPNNMTLPNGQDGYCYTTPMGMHRAGTTYAGCANGFGMQSRAAEGFKATIIQVVRATRTPGHDLHGSFVVNEVHDELILEIPEDARTPERVEVLCEMMKENMRLVIPDVDIQVEAALMRNWNKKAKPVFDEHGRLTVWESKS